MKHYGESHHNEEIRKAVVAILYNPLKRTFLLRQDQDESKYTQFIRGGIDDGETELQAISREVKEETGITDIKVLNKITENFIVHQFMTYKNNWRATECAVYLVTYSFAGQEQLNLDTEEFANFKLIEIPITSDFKNEYSSEDYISDLFSKAANIIKSN